jgi:predicted SnoaL-like aldol condensation-catalyzing enzyme
MDGVRKLASIVANHPDARGEIKRVFADGDHVILHSHSHHDDLALDPVAGTTSV